jgi:hypothetical protein
MGSTRPGSPVRCTYCGGRGTLIEVDLRGIRYDYCDAACATAHRQAVELTGVLCADCDEDAVGDTGFCDEHVAALDVEPPGLAPAGWRRAG